MKSQIVGAVLLLTLLAARLNSDDADWARGTGTVKLDSDGFASVHLPDHYLDDHFCTVADGWDEITVGFSTKVFTLSDGKPDQEIQWACVPYWGNQTPKRNR
jgi:hypothetical protein